MQSQSQAKGVDEIARDLVQFMRLVAFRGDPSYSTGLEFLSLSDVTAVGLQGHALTVDVILGPFLSSILECHHSGGDAVGSEQVGEQLMSVDDRTVPTSEKQEQAERRRVFSDSIRSSLLCSLISTVAGKTDRRTD